MTTTAPVGDADLALLVGVHRTLCEVRKANEGSINLRAEDFITRAWEEATRLVLGSISTVFREHAADPLFDVPTAIASAFEFCAQSYADSELTDEDLNRFVYTRMDHTLYARAWEIRQAARAEQ
jgi:hypothetical protein